MNKESIDLLIKKNPRLKSARANLEAMRAGAYCIHRSWGLGLIRDYDEKDNRLIIDFEDENKMGHPMDPVFCLSKLAILPSNSVLVRQRKEPEKVNELIKKHPTDLIVEILKNCSDQAASTSEIEKQLSRLLGDTKYRKWWTATKKLLIKDPRIAVPTRKTDPYILRDEPVKAEDEILDDFFMTKAPKKKINLAEKLFNLSLSHEDIQDALPDVLRTLTAAIQETRQLNPGERLHGLWVRNDLARFIHEDVETLQPTSASILADAEDLSLLSRQIPNSRHKRFLDLINRTFTEDWEKKMIDLLRNSEGKFTNECISFLIEKEKQENLKNTLRRWLDEQTIKGPVLFWIVKNRHTRRFSKMLHELINPRLLNAIFYAIDYESLQNAGTRRIPLADFLSDDAELIPEILSEATAETAYDLATTLMLNQGFEDLSKRSLMARFIRVFPKIEKLVAGDSGPTKVKTSQGLIVSKWSFEKRQKEYDILVKEKIPENKKAIATAREHGDLRENAEYKMARQEQETLLARKSILEKDLSRAQQSDFSDAPSDVVGIGTVVDLIQGSTKETVTYNILGAWDSDPEKDVLSYETPLAQQLLSKAIGQTVSTNIDGHQESWTIAGIRRWFDEQESK